MTRLSRSLKILIALGLLLVAAAMAVQTGLARRAFFEIYARIADVEVLGPAALRIPPRDSPYQRWLARARTAIPVFDGPLVADVHSVPLRPWPQMGDGVTGLYLPLADSQLSDGRILEIPARGRTAGERHLFEEVIYFMGGPGHTIIQQEGAASQRVDWQAGSLFAVPLNVRHEHVNDGDGAVRLAAFTSFPFMLNSLNSERFIYDNPFAFTDRYDGAADYLERAESPAADWLTTNFVEDIRGSDTSAMELRGRGNTVMHWTMAGNSMLSVHVSEMPPRSYKKAHRHSNDVSFLLLSGEGYTLAWPAHAYHERRRVDWQAGALFAPPTYWHHQHMNSGSTPARYLSVNTPDLLLNLGLRFTDQVEIPLHEVIEEWEEELGKKQRERR